MWVIPYTGKFENMDSEHRKIYIKIKGYINPIDRPKFINALTRKFISIPEWKYKKHFNMFTNSRSVKNQHWTKIQEYEF
jgi:hypothetical protein